MILADLLQDQNPWWRDAAIRRARGYPVRRELQPKILDRILRVDDRRAVVLLGPRQVDVWRRLRSSIAARSIVRDLSSLGVDVSTAPANRRSRRGWRRSADDRPIAAVTFPDPYPFYAELVARVAAAPSVAYRPSANVRIPGRPAP